MKFLGIRNQHDTNITYTDGTKVKYLKLERNLQDKHYSCVNYDKIIAQEFDIIFRKSKEILGVDFRSLDGIALSVVYPEERFKFQPFVHVNELYQELDKRRYVFWDQFKCPVYNLDHHYAHALSCWPMVDVGNTNSIVTDGMGSHKRFFSAFVDGDLKDYIDITECDSFSLLMNVLGNKLGMQGIIIDHAGKLMALKAFHQMNEKFIEEVFEYSKYMKFRNMHSFLELVEALQERKGQNPNDRQSIIDLTYLVHEFASRKFPDYISQFIKDDETFTYTGGTAQNTVLNTVLKKRYKNMIIPPHCPDDGISLGCVEFLRRLYKQPEFETKNFPFWQSDEAPRLPTDSVIDKAAELLAQNKIVGWYQGNGELGPRALGNRSILMNPTIKNGKDIMNSKVKHREEYRPFGASILSENVNDVFDWNEESPYMLYNAECRYPDDYSSIVHVDGSCRIQTVNHNHEYFYRLIDAFKTKTGIPAVLNTSLNINGKPIAGHMKDAKTLYENTEIDALVIGDKILVK